LTNTLPSLSENQQSEIWETIDKILLTVSIPEKKLLFNFISKNHPTASKWADWWTQDDVIGMVTSKNQIEQSNSCIRIPSSTNLVEQCNYQQLTRTGCLMDELVGDIMKDCRTPPKMNSSLNNLKLNYRGISTEKLLAGNRYLATRNLQKQQSLKLIAR